MRVGETARAATPFVLAKVRENAGTDGSVPRRPPYPAEASILPAPRGRSRLSPMFSPPGAHGLKVEIRNGLPEPAPR